jgi:hypothetical protein
MALACAFAANARCGEVTPSDLQAVANTFNFAEGLPHSGPIAVGVVFASDQPEAKIEAARLAARLDAIHGPNDLPLQGVAISVDELARLQYPPAVLLLLSGTIQRASVINEVARRHHLITISTDPSCLDAKCCVLMVQANDRVKIVLDTAVADAVGANFSSIFAMMVERR